MKRRTERLLSQQTAITLRLRRYAYCVGIREFFDCQHRDDLQMLTEIVISAGKISFGKKEIDKNTVPFVKKKSEEKAISSYEESAINSKTDEFGRTGEDTLRPGPFAKESITARSPSRDFTKAERNEIDKIGKTHGCHTCGKKEPGTKHGHFIPDHQAPSALNTNGEPQKLFPHCLICSRKQAGQVTQRKRNLEK